MSMTRMAISQRDDPRLRRLLKLLKKCYAKNGYKYEDVSKSVVRLGPKVIKNFFHAQLS